MLSEYAPAVRDGKEVALPAWFFPPSISPIAGSLILSLIHIDPQQRCTAVEALKHPWSTGEGMEGSKRFTTQIKQIPHPTVAAPRLNIKPKPSISSSSTLSQASFTPAPLVPSSSVQSTPLSVPGSLTTCSRPVRTRSHPQSSPPIPILESVLEEPIEGERVSIINELRVLPLVPSSLPLVALSVPAEEAITVDERRVVDDIRCSNLFRDHQQGQGQSSVQSEATVTQPRADLVSVISVKINPVTPQYACTDRSPDNNSLLAAPLPISIVQSCSRPQLTPVASEGSSAGSGSGLRLCSNQTPNQANPSSDLLRREQVRERGKGRQEEERSDRYRSSLQQQRQKEEAALALDLQLCWDIDQISNFSPNLPREKK
jgi:serine/threonine protein kinase